MSIEAIESATDRVRLADRPVLVPPHITAAAQSLGISAAQMAQAFSVGSSLSDVAQVRGISQQDLIAAMEANPPANLAVLAAAPDAGPSVFAPVGVLDTIA